MPKKPVQIVHQEVHWVEPPSNRVFEVDQKTPPDRLWVLFNELNRGAKPSLPIRAVERVNAIQEPWGDDWSYRRGSIEISGRTELGGNGFWVLVEWTEKV